MTKQEQLIIILLIISALIGTGLLYLRKFRENNVHLEVVEAEEWRGIREVVVEVKGACWKPGVYTLPYGARVKDLIELACPRKDAEMDGINLAKVLRDGESIFIPSVSIMDNRAERVTPAYHSDYGRENRKQIDKIDINSASIEELEKLPQIGPKIARYIIEYRNRNGPFKKVEDIKKVEKIGEKTFEKIKTLITVE